MKNRAAAIYKIENITLYHADFLNISANIYGKLPGRGSVHESRTAVCRGRNRRKVVHGITGQDQGGVKCMKMLFELTGKERDG